MRKNFKNLISPWVQCTSITNRVLSSFDRFTTSYNCMRKNFKHSYLCVFSAKVSQIVFSSHMTVLGLFPTAWSKSSKISYLREFSAQVSQIVFLAYLTVLRFFITKWRKASKILYLNKFTEQVSQIVFWAHLTVLRLITSVWGKTSKSHISVSSVHKYHKSCSEFIWPFYDLLTTVWGKSSKIFLLWEFSPQVSQNRVLSSFDRFRAYSNCMRLNLRNLISSRVQCTGITNRIFSYFDHFTVFTTVWSKTSKISYLREFSAQVSQIVFWVHLTVLRLLTTIWGKTSKISYLYEFSAKV